MMNKSIFTGLENTEENRKMLAWIITNQLMKWNMKQHPMARFTITSFENGLCIECKYIEEDNTFKSFEENGLEVHYKVYKERTDRPENYKIIQTNFCTYEVFPMYGKAFIYLWDYDGNRVEETFDSFSDLSLSDLGKYIVYSKDLLDWFDTWYPKATCRITDLSIDLRPHILYKFVNSKYYKEALYLSSYGKVKGSLINLGKYVTAYTNYETIISRIDYAIGDAAIFDFDVYQEIRDVVLRLDECRNRAISYEPMSKAGKDSFIDDSWVWKYIVDGKTYFVSSKENMKEMDSIIDNRVYKNYTAHPLTKKENDAFKLLFKTDEIITIS